MRRIFIALSVVVGMVGILAISATPTAAAKPSSSYSATMVITNTSSTCTGTLTVLFSVQGKGGVTGITWSTDTNDTGSLSFLSGGELYSKPQKSGSAQTSFTLTAGTGQADVTVQGSDFRLPVIKSNTVTCSPTAPDLTITDISQTAPPGYPPPWSYTVTVQNIGNATADVTNAVVQGYYTSSSDTTMYPPPGGSPPIAGGDPACGTIMQPFATSLAPGDSVDVIVGCSSGPTASADTNLMVGVDVNNSVAESNENNNVAVIALS